MMANILALFLEPLSNLSVKHLKQSWYVFVPPKFSTFITEKGRDN